MRCRTAIEAVFTSVLYESGVDNHNVSFVFINTHIPFSIVVYLTCLMQYIFFITIIYKILYVLNKYVYFKIRETYNSKRRTWPNHLRYISALSLNNPIMTLTNFLFTHLCNLYKIHNASFYVFLYFPWSSYI